MSFLENINEYVDALSETATSFMPGFSLDTSMPWLKDLFRPDVDYKTLIEKAIEWAGEHRDGIIGVM
ncbi:MAG: hypothetical protein VB112_04420 [Oscillospiraceae bacterium]|nr:hypothetical protein [Oscillospiraceae bacterium]